jgi:hypothetical protein
LAPAKNSASKKLSPVDIGHATNISNLFSDHAINTENKASKSRTACFFVDRYNDPSTKRSNNSKDPPSNVEKNYPHEVARQR